MQPVKTILVSTGEELVRGRSVDTNSSYLATELEGLGFRTVRMVTVGDEPEAMRSAISAALDDARLVVVTGGLGPTADDRTRGAIAEAVGAELEEDGESLEALRDRLAQYGREVDDRQIIQARFPHGSVIFPNPQGTARGFAAKRNGHWVVAMPGVPREMVHMFEQSVGPFVLDQFGRGGAILGRSLHLFPIAEPDVDALLRDLTAADANPLVGITVTDGVVTVTLRARADTEQEACAMLDESVDEVKDRFGDVVYGYDGETVAAALGRVMAHKDVTVGVAESLTGGLIGDMLVDVPGISSFFLADVVAYSNQAKESLLGVPHEKMVAHGAVSAPVARAMAEGACRAAGSSLGISTTGIAGPTGGTEEKPVGLVFVGICHEGRTHVTKLNVSGSRARVKDRTAKYALNSARLALEQGLERLDDEREL